MATSTKVKTKQEIARVRELFNHGNNIKQVAQQIGFSVNTVRKILRREQGYEGQEFNPKGRWMGPSHSRPVHFSEIDGEELHLQRPTKDGYIRVSINSERQLLHRHEAQKAYKCAGRKWPEAATVHHINYNHSNNAPQNLTVFKSKSLHRQHHGQIELAMYKFLDRLDLLETFYEHNPSLKLETLADVIK